MTGEQRRAFEQLRALAAPLRLRVKADVEGWPIIEGRLGRIEWFCDGADCHSCPLPAEFALAAYTDRRLMRAKLLAIPGVQPHQRGDDELRVVFRPPLLAEVARVIRARVRRQASPEGLEALARWRAGQDAVGGRVSAVSGGQKAGQEP